MYENIANKNNLQYTSIIPHPNSHDQGKRLGHYDINKPIGMKRKVLSIDKQKSIGWKPKTDLERGIELAYKDFIKRIV